MHACMHAVRRMETRNKEKVIQCLIINILGYRLHAQTPILILPRLRFLLKACYNPS